MALSEGSWTEQPASKPRYSTGSLHSSAIKKALQAKRVAVRHAPDMIRGLVEIANDTEQPGSTRVVAMQAVLERGLGRASMAPEDAATLQAIAAAPGDFLAQLLQMRAAAIQHQVIDASSTEATLVDMPGGEAKLIP